MTSRKSPNNSRPLSLAMKKNALLLPTRFPQEPPASLTCSPLRGTGLPKPSPPRSPEMPAEKSRCTSRSTKAPGIFSLFLNWSRPFLREAISPGSFRTSKEPPQIQRPSSRFASPLANTTASVDTPTWKLKWPGKSKIQPFNSSSKSPPEPASKFAHLTSRVLPKRSQNTFTLASRTSLAAPSTKTKSAKTSRSSSPPELSPSPALKKPKPPIRNSISLFTSRKPKPAEFPSQLVLDPTKESSSEHVTTTAISGADSGILTPESKSPRWVPSARSHSPIPTSSTAISNLTDASLPSPAITMLIRSGSRVSRWSSPGTFPSITTPARWGSPTRMPILAAAFLLILSVKRTTESPACHSGNDTTVATIPLSPPRACSQNWTPPSEFPWEMRASPSSKPQPRLATTKR